MNDSHQNKTCETIGETISWAANRLQRHRLFNALRNVYLCIVAVFVLVGLLTVKQNLSPVSVPNSNPRLFPDFYSYRIPWEDAFKGIPFPIYASLVLLTIPFVRESRQTREKLRGLKAALTHIESPDAISQLTPWLESGDRTARKVASERLTALLPSMLASDAHLLTDDDHHRLNRQLGGADIEFILAILSAYEQVGDERDALVVRYLYEGLDSAKLYPKVQQAAEECLSYIDSRAKSNRESQTLLRPSNVSNDASEILVRPAINSPLTEPDKLVRPVELNTVRGSQ